MLCSASYASRFLLLFCLSSPLFLNVICTFGMVSILFTQSTHVCVSNSQSLVRGYSLICWVVFISIVYYCLYYDLFFNVFCCIVWFIFCIVFFATCVVFYLCFTHFAWLVGCCSKCERSFLNIQRFVMAIRCLRSYFLVFTSG